MPSLVPKAQVLSRIAHASLVTLLVCNFAACERSSSAKPSPGPIPDSPKATKVTVHEVAISKRNITIPLVGTLHAAEEVVISTKASGVLLQTFVEIGDAPKPGDPLARVDTVSYEVAMKQAESSLAEALARLGTSELPGEEFDLKGTSSVQRAEAQKVNAQFTYERLLALRETSASQIAEQELSDAVMNLRVSEVNHRLALEEAAALVATARERDAELQMARKRWRDTLTLTPPLPSTLGTEAEGSWVVAQRLVTEGQYLNEADPLYRLIVRDPLKLRSRIPERYASFVKVGQTVSLAVSGTTDRVAGIITRISPDVDIASRTFEIEALVANPSLRIVPGAFATGRLFGEDLQGRIWIPESALIKAEGLNRVFAVVDGMARLQPVEVGVRAEDRIEVVNGLTPGMSIAVGGADSLVDGAAVEVEELGD